MAISKATVWLLCKTAGDAPVLLTTTVATFVLAFWPQITLHPGWGSHAQGGLERGGGVLGRWPTGRRSEGDRERQMLDRGHAMLGVEKAETVPALGDQGVSKSKQR